MAVSYARVSIFLAKIITLYGIADKFPLFLVIKEAHTSQIKFIDPGLCRKKTVAQTGRYLVK